MGRLGASGRWHPDPEHNEASKRRRWRAAAAVAAGTVIVVLVALVTIESSGTRGDYRGSEGAGLTTSPSSVPLLPIRDVAGAAGTENPATNTTAATTPTAVTTTAAPSPLGVTRVFSASSPFNLPIVDDPVVDLESDRIAAALSEKVVANLYEFGIAIYEVDESTDPVSVECTKPWGTCLLESDVHRVPDQAEPAPGDDGTLVVIDWSEGRTVEMWQAVRRSPALWSTSWGTTTPIDGSGIPAVFGNGSGVSHLAGVIRVAEITNGRIDHALVFSTSNACRDEFRYPATKTDGDSTEPDCIAEGARIQLDPSLDLETLRLTRAERAIARALQIYGAYAVDTGGTPMAFYFEVAADASSLDSGSAYDGAGLTRDYFPMSGIPWQHLRVLSTWDGS